MADNVAVTAGSGTTVAADEVIDGTLGTVKVQYVKLMDGALDGTTKAGVGANGLAVSATQTGTWTVQPGNTANTTPWLAKLHDGTNAVAVKAASTAPGATDPALVVAISPNSVNANGQATMANSAPIVPASNWEGSVTLKNFGAGEYETVAASQTAQVLGATGGTGDYISGILVIPATTSPGNVLLLDNATSITVFTGGATSVSNLVPFFIPLGMISVSGAWKVTTGANVSCIGIGNFT